MLFWHIGATLFLFRWIFRDPKVDVRFLIAGSILPDVIDLPLGTWFLGERFSTGELWMHTLAAPSVVVMVLLVVTRRGRLRRAWMAFAVAMFFHLFLDGMWTNTEIFLWPFAGLGFPRGPDPYWAGAWERALAEPWRWIGEAAGLVYLVWLAIRLGLFDRKVVCGVWRTGRLPEAAAL